MCSCGCLPLCVIVPGIRGDLARQQLSEQTRLLGQLFVGALLHDPALVENDDPVGYGDAGDAVGHQQYHPVPGKTP